MTRSADNWRSLPGRFDTVNGFFIPDHLSKHGIPVIKRDRELSAPKFLAPYRTRIRGENGWIGGAAHFFLDDYRFDQVWSRPNHTLSAILEAGMALSPDFSLYRDYPEAIQIWNTYRNRWCGAWWQSKGVMVIPTIGWSGPESYEFCFTGVEKGSIIAVSSAGIGKAGEQAFHEGYCEMVERLEPLMVLCYGRLPARLGVLADFQEYPTRWEGIRQALIKE